MSGLLAKLLRSPKHPLIRGMLSYAIIWPTCTLVHEYIEHGTSLAKANWYRAARFSFFGTFFMAPVFYGWMRYSNKFFEGKDLMTAISRAAVEQVTYSPLAMAYFFFGMSMLEGKSSRVSANEVREKFWPTYMSGLVFWPTVQTFNFFLVSEKNRMVVVSLASFFWTVYLAHMLEKDPNDKLSDSSFPNIEVMSTDLENRTVESDKDTAELDAGEISSESVKQNVESFDYTRREPNMDVNEDSVMVTDNKMYGVNQPRHVSDVRSEGSNTQSVLETHTDSEPEEDDDDFGSDISLEFIFENLDDYYSLSI